MASVCGASLALFDAGVPMTTATAGVACGLITQAGSCDNDTFPEYKILTDISVGDIVVFTSDKTKFVCY